MDMKDQARESLLWLRAQERCDVHGCLQHFARVVKALEEHPALAEEWRDLLWAVIELYASKLDGGRRMGLEVVWGAIAKRLASEDPVRLAHALIVACEGHSESFYPFPLPRQPIQPIPEVVARVSNDPGARNLLKEAIKTGRGGAFLSTWMQHV